jgi:RHS repeat-associated protein
LYLILIIMKNSKSIIGRYQPGHTGIYKIKFFAIALMSLYHLGAFAQAPSLTYSGYGGPQQYTVGTAITTLTPANSGGTIVARGQSSNFAGLSGVQGYFDATGVLALFKGPAGVCVDGSGNVYVADASNNMIRKITSAGVVSTLAGNTHAGTTNGTGTAAYFTHPTGVAVDGSGNVYVADSGDEMIRKITSAGVVTTLAGTANSPGHADGTGTAATFSRPSGVALDGAGNLFVADYSNNEIRKIVISTGVVTTFAGATTSGSTNGTGTAARFNNPNAITIDGSGNLYVADFHNNMIRKITSAAVVTTLAGSTTAGSSDGTGTAASFNEPAAITLNGSSNIYVADDANGKVRMITTGGVVTTYTSSLSAPQGIVINSSGTIFLGETGANQIDKITPYNYTISPALPAGLSFNTTTGVISGTPVAASSSTDYAITAVSASGSGSVILDFAVGLLTSYDAGNRGFIQSETIKISGITQDSMIYALNDVQKQTTRVYFDGLGRTVQSIGLQASPLERDMIQPVAYDNLGRQTVGYLGYAGQGTDAIGSYRANALTTAQPAFYNQTSQYLIAKDTAAHTNSVIEASPLQRLLKSGMVGSGYQPEDSGTQHYKTVSYRYNTSGDGNILIWNFDGTFTSGNYYATSALSVVDGTDEDGTETRTFTDKTGHLILKRQILGGTNLDTYYIYNMAGMVSNIVPPAATSALAANSYSLTTAPLMNMVFYYTYNTFGQVVSRKAPAKGVMYIVYDPLNRPVLSQDANMAASHTWTYIKYDVKGRVINTGIYTDATHTSYSSMQTYVSGLASSYATAWFESRTTVGAFLFYTNTIFPTTVTAKTFNYYDDYDVDNTGGANYNYTSQGLPNEETQTTAPLKGMPTVAVQNVVGSGLSSMWLTKVVFYDKRGNIIQTKSTNHLNYTTPFAISDTATVVPDFVGVPQITLVKQRVSATILIKVQTNLTYDQMYRIKTVDQYYNGSATVSHVAAYTYNELGQVIKKSLGFVSGTTWLQNVNMRFNIRAQLLSINNSKLANDTGKTSNDTNDIFGAIYLYDKVDANLGNTAYFNGKLSAVKWMSKDGSGASSYERAYKYNYDAVNRYTASNYAERATAGTGSFNNNVGGFDESGITYDMDGNIKTLKRNSSTQGTNTHIQIDSLTYGYSPTIPDQLNTVTDGTGANYTGAGFRNLTGSTGNYTYDANGNLTADPYKGLTLTYDYLNKTDKITVTTSTNRYIYYTYNASGELLRKQQYDNAVLQTTTDYVNGFVYITQSGTTALSYFPMPEGRVVNNGGTLTQEFIIGDQQGNARISFNNTGTGGTAKVIQENSYYAFGLVLLNSPVATPTIANKKLYNGGSEWQNDYGNLPDYYETFNRNYDAALGRWVGVDPVGEYSESKTSYNYAGNNPVMYNDPLGDKLPNGEFGRNGHFYNGNGQEIFAPNPIDQQSYVSPLLPGDGPLDGDWQNEGAFADGYFAPEGDYSAFWESALSAGGDILDAINSRDDISGFKISAGALGQLATLENGISQGLTANWNFGGSGNNSIANDVNSSFSGDRGVNGPNYQVDGNQHYVASTRFYPLDGNLSSPDHDLDHHLYSTIESGSYLFLAVVREYQVSDIQWMVTTDLFYQGSDIENVALDMSTSMQLSLTERPEPGIQRFEIPTGASITYPANWGHYIGSSSYPFTSINDVGTFYINIHASAIISTFWGSHAEGGGTTDVTVPIVSYP